MTPLTPLITMKNNRGTTVGQLLSFPFSTRDPPFEKGVLFTRNQRVERKELLVVWRRDSG